MPAFPGIGANEVIDWAASLTGPVMVKGTGTAFYFNGTTAVGITGTGTGTGTSVTYPGTTVRGLQYLDGTFYVMEPDGTINNSSAANDDPQTWPTDGFITAELKLS